MHISFLHDLKNLKNNYEGVLLLLKLQASACNFTKSDIPAWVFSRFLNYASGTKSRKAFYVILHHFDINLLRPQQCQVSI